MVELQEVEAAYKSLQRLLHPDLFHQRTPEEQNISAENSALVNGAYQTVRHPLDRIKHLLEQRGVIVLSEASGTAVCDPKLLLEVLELRCVLT